VKVAVVAHAGKTIGGGLPELRRVLEAHGVSDPLWLEVPKSKRAPEQVRRALDEGADVVFSWGGDGMARRCIGELAGSDAALAIVPAGTSNLLAPNLGRVAYLWSGSRNLRHDAFGADIRVDGTRWYKGEVSCILVGNVGELFGGVEVFPDAQPDDGWLDFGIVTAAGLTQWTRILARTAVGDPARSPFVRTTRARRVKVKLDRKVRYELDGGDRSKVRSFKVKVDPATLTVCVPATAQTVQRT
jgi:diacylglycerol kinase (ATP)